MQIKVFTIPVLSADKIETDVNAFLRSHRVLQIDRQFTHENGGYWTILVTYIDGSPKDDTSFSRKEKVDYRQVLSEEEFARFARFREIRKSLAQNENVPPYVIFTDEELATLAKIDTITLASIKEIKGIGEKKAEKYGIYFVEN